MNETGPSWTFIVDIFSWVITFLLGILVSILKMEAARNESRLKKLEDNYKTLNDKVLGEYPSKADLDRMLHDLKERLQILDTKIDSLLMIKMEK